ncbi:MAG: YigZ family protein [Clostridia bacterium]|nr:YigZ family protein [Clostridia bacterium]
MSESNAQPYVTLGSEASAVFTEKRSEFIGYAAPVQTEEAAMEFVNKIRKKHGDARHNVYAYLLKNGYAKYSDDGEPQGTAGIPTLEVIKKGGFCDAVIVVTRYFGGILLGAGGLVRAYTAAARMACEAAGIVTYKEFITFSLTCSYTEYQRLLPVFKKHNIITDSTEFTDCIKLSLAAESADLSAFNCSLAELSAGKLTTTETGKRFGA